VNIRDRRGYRGDTPADGETLPLKVNVTTEAEVGAYRVAGLRSSEPVEPGEGPIHAPAGPPRAGAVGGALAGDLGWDAPGSQEATVGVVAVAAVGEQAPGPVTGPSWGAAEVRYRVEQGHELDDVGTVSAGQGHGRRGFRAGR